MRNAAGTIEETLDSVAAQSYRKVEHIVIDGASIDGTRQILERRRRRVAAVVSEPDDGIYDAMNKGIALARGEVIGTLNAGDVYFTRDVLNEVAGVFENADVEACYADLIYVAEQNPNRVIRYWTSRDYAPGLFERGWLPAHPTFFVRRSVYERFGAFDLRYRIQADFDLTMRLLAVHRICSVYVPRIFVRMRMGGATNNSLANVIRGNLESWRACRRNGLDVSPWFFVTKIGQRLPQFIRRPHAFDEH